MTRTQEKPPAGVERGGRSCEGGQTARKAVCPGADCTQSGLPPYCILYSASASAAVRGHSPVSFSFFTHIRLAAGERRGKPRGQPVERQGDKLRPPQPDGPEGLPTAFPILLPRISPDGPQPGAHFFHPHPRRPHPVHKSGPASPNRLTLCPLRPAAGCGQKGAPLWTGRG